MEMISLEQELQRNAYPGRGIILGKSADGTKRQRPILSWAEVRTAATAFSWRMGKESVPRLLTRRR